MTLKHVAGWDDPRLPTIAGMRRRGYPPAALRDFVSRIGVTKKEHMIQMSLLENCVREDLNVRSARAMAVLNPLKVVLTNYPADRTELLPAANHPDRPELGERQLPFGRELWIEQDDFMEDAPKKFFRLRPGGEVRLRYGYIIKCVDLRKDADGRVTEVHCTVRSGDPQRHERRRAQGEGHDSLGQRGARGAWRKSGSMTGSSPLPDPMGRRQTSRPS